MPRGVLGACTRHHRRVPALVCLPHGLNSLRMLTSHIARFIQVIAQVIKFFPMATLLDAAGVPLVLVGDSLGMVVLGYPDTTHVTLDEMAHHTAAVARAMPSGLVVADLPYQSYETPEQAVTS